MLKNPRFLRLQQLVTVILVGLLVFLLIRYLDQQWSQLDEYLYAIDPARVVLAGVGFMVGLSLLPLNAWLILRSLEIDLSAWEVWRTFFFSQVAKYLPGSVWTLPSRAYLFNRAGVSPSQSIAVVIWEVMLMIMGAAVVAILGTSQLVADTFLPLFVWGVVALLGGLLLGRFLLRLPRMQDFFRRLPLPGNFRDSLLLFAQQLKFHQMILIILLYAVTWSVIGLAFTILVYAVVPDVDGVGWLGFAGLFAGAWIVGFLVIITPGGIGVRDGLLILGLSTIMEEPLPFVIAVLARLLWTIAEMVGVVYSVLIHRYFQSRQTT